MHQGHFLKYKVSLLYKSWCKQTPVAYIKRIITTKSNICIFVWRQTLFYMHESYISKNNKICFSWYMSRNNHLLMISWLIRKMYQICCIINTLLMHTFDFWLNVHNKKSFHSWYVNRNLSLHKSVLFWFFLLFKKKYALLPILIYFKSHRAQKVNKTFCSIGING